MARRISLPSSDELFGDHAPYAGRPADTTATANGEEAAQAVAPVPRRKASPRRPATRSRAAARSKPEPPAAPATEGTPVAPQRRSNRAPSRGAPLQARRRGVAARIDRVEGRLRDLPIDSLLELRDGLEELLMGGAVTDADVERILASTET